MGIRQEAGILAMNKQAVLLTAFDGDGEAGRWREAIHSTIRNIAKYVDLPIYLATDNSKSYQPIDCCIVHEVEGISRGHKRHGFRSSNYWRVKLPLQMKHTTFLYLDLDIRIIDPAFIKGFDLAEKFGFCLPTSPRAFACIENTKGIDAIGRQNKQAEFQAIYSHATSYITGVMFMNASIGNAGLYMQEYIRLYETEPERAPSIAIKAAINTGIYPYLLPPQWCVTYHNRDSITENTFAKPLAVHVSDEGVAEKFKDLL